MEAPVVRQLNGLIVITALGDDVVPIEITLTKEEARQLSLDLSFISVEGVVPCNSAHKSEEGCVQCDLCKETDEEGDVFRDEAAKDNDIVADALGRCSQCPAELTGDEIATGTCDKCHFRLMELAAD